ncbi:hypothetical protein H6P81_006686 [Aristolochia fimbriata]|uniref:Integrase catalytic domain-containing protein n=1 Tax=Aristolochia fimbriata TaxID=158543 RepID=A0AAV7F1V9_ARIFI|nr:hypothetical protein H6P81_006686 [Aristolochia fimbriata]
MANESSPKSSTTPTAFLLAHPHNTSRGVLFDLGQTLGQICVIVNNITHHVSIKLDRDNYLLWRQQFLPVFNSQSLMGFVDGPIQPPPQYSPTNSSIVTPEYLQWYALDQTIQSWIVATLSNAAIGQTIGLTSASALWLKLQRVYASTSQARLNHLRFTLQTLRKGSLSMGSYLDRVKTIVDDLAAAGQPLDDQTVTHYVVNGLGPDFEPFAQTVTGQVDPVSFDTLTNLLLTQEHRLQLRVHLQHLDSSSRPSLNVAARGHRGGGRAGRGRHSRGCGQNGGRGFGRNQQDRNDSSNRPLCQTCNKRGHTVIQCHNRFNLSYQPPAPPEAHSAQLENSSDSAWYIDSGASHHISSDASLLTDSGPYNRQDQVMLGNESGLPISAIGTLHLTPSLPLQKVLSVPSSLKNLLSVSKLTSDHNCQVLFYSNGFRVQEANTGKLLLKGPSRNGLYVVDHNASPSCLLSSVSDFSFWHRRLGHPGASVMRHVFHNLNIVVSDSPNNTCHACRIIKSPTLPFSSSQTRPPSKLHTISADIWGPCPITSFNGYRYYIYFADHYSRFTWLFLLSSKTEVPSIFAKFQILVENQFSAKIKVFQSDGGIEFMSKKFQDLLSSSGIHHNVSCPYTPQQNGLVERKHRHIVEMGLTLLAPASMPKSHWDSTFATSVYIINRLPTPILHSKSPFDVLVDVAKNKVYVSRNVVFDETIFPYSQPALLPTPKPSSSSTAPSIPLLPLPPIVPSPVPSSVPTVATPITSPVPSTVPTVATPSDIHTVSTPTGPTPENFSSVPEIRTRARPGAPLPTHPMTTWSMTNSLPPRTFFTSKHPLPNPKPPSVPTCYSQAIK